MAMSRMALLAAALQSPAAPPQLVTAEQALEIHEQTFEGVVTADGCAKGSEGEEIVVCRRRGASPRYTGPVSRAPGARETLPGELGRAPTSVGGCLSRCHQPLSVDLIGAGRAIARGIGRLFDPDS